jgi:hypothetical protein
VRAGAPLLRHTEQDSHVHLAQEFGRWLGSSLSSSGPSKARSVVPRLGIVVLAELGEAHVAHPQDHGADASALRTVGHDQ